MNKTTATHTARTPETARMWEENPHRLVTFSTGVVHVAREVRPGRFVTLCSTRSATRTGATGATPTCRMCGADPIA